MTAVVMVELSTPTLREAVLLLGAYVGCLRAWQRRTGHLVVFFPVFASFRGRGFFCVFPFSSFVKGVFDVSHHVY